MRRWLTSKRSQKDERDRSEGPTPLETSTSPRHAESGARDLAPANYETQQPEGRELSYDLDEEQPHPAQPLPQAMKAEHLKPLAPLRRHKLVKSVVALLILVGLAATISWQWPHFIGLLLKP